MRFLSQVQAHYKLYAVGREAYDPWNVEFSDFGTWLIDRNGEMFFTIDSIGENTLRDPMDSFRGSENDLIKYLKKIYPMAKTFRTKTRDLAERLHQEGYKVEWTGLPFNGYFRQP